jgi:uncharacterized protein
MNKKKLLRWVKIIAIIYTIIGAILFFTQRFFLFHGKKLPSNYNYSFNEQAFIEQNVTRANGTNLNFLQFLPTDTALAGFVIYYHGNMQNINRYAPFIRIFTANGYAVLMQDYPGFGKSTGKITEQQMKDDAQLVYNFAKVKMPNNISIYGKSMGTGLACYIAAQNKCNRVILETPYYSLPTVYDDYAWMYPTKLLLQFQFNNYKMMPLIKAPITIFHGSNDGLISIKNASKLKQFLKPIDEFVTVDKATHNDIADYQIYTDKLDSILSVDTYTEQQ